MAGHEQDANASRSQESRPSGELQITPEKLGRELLRTLFYSFAVSQGSIQNELLRLAGAFYGTAYTKTLLRAAADQVSRDRVKALRLPSAHGPVSNPGRPTVEPTSDEGRRMVAAQLGRYWDGAPDGSLIGSALNPRFDYEPEFH